MLSRIFILVIDQDDLSETDSDDAHWFIYGLLRFDYLLPQNPKTQMK
jgi:hypothetical protein